MISSRGWLVILGVGLLFFLAPIYGAGVYSLFFVLFTIVFTFVYNSFVNFQVKKNRIYTWEQLKNSEEFNCYLTGSEKFKAIRMCRAYLGMDINEAMNAVDGCLNADGSVKKDKGSIPSTSDIKELMYDQEFNAAIRDGKINRATKLCRKINGCSLNEAKSIVTHIILKYR